MRAGTAVGLGLFIGMGCGGTAEPAPKPPVVTVADAGAPVASVAPPPAPVPPPSWVPSQRFADLGGRRGAVVNGRRVVLDGSGKATVADDAPVPELGDPHELPPALGGGWLFFGVTALHFAKTFDGPLVTVVTGVKEMEPGFASDRVFVGGKTYVLSTGKEAPLPVPDTVQMFGLPSGQTAVRNRTNDVFFSPAPGKPFTKVAGGAERIGYDGSTFVLISQTAERVLGLDGKVGVLVSTKGPRMMSADNLMAFHFPDVRKAPPAAPDPDRMVSPLSAAMSDEVVVRVEGHDLEVFDGHRGVLTSKQRDAFAGHENCFVIRGGTPAFVGCNDAETMNLFRIDSAEAPPVLEKSFKGDYSQDFGFPAFDAALALPRRCDGSPALGVFCVRSAAGIWTETPALADPGHLLGSAPFVVGVVASKDGAPYGFGWQNGAGDLIVADVTANAVHAIGKGDLPAWAQRGIRWQAVTASGGSVHFLVPGEHAGILTIDANGKLATRALDGRLAAAGARGLLVTPDGKISETLDAGAHWQDVEPPPGGAAPFPLQCEEAGCTVGPWLRLGWSR